MSYASSAYLSTEQYHSIDRQFARSPNRRFGFVKAESSSENSDAESDGKENDGDYRQRIQSYACVEKVEQKPERGKERKHSLFNGRNQHSHEDKVKELKNSSTHSLVENHKHHTSDEKSKEKKHSTSHFSAMDHVKRKLSSTFRRNSTSTSPELTHRKAPLISKSVSVVSNSPEMARRKAPLKSNSSSLVSHSDSPRNLRRYALLNHEEPRRRCDTSTTEKQQSFTHPLVMSRKRSMRTQLESASNPDIVSSTPYHSNGKMKDFNVYCLGTRQTGKTALAVRFLTGRYIHEYISTPVEKYSRVMSYGGERVNVNLYIRDTEKLEEDIELSSNSAIMVIYSVTDKSSFREATVLLQHLKQLSITDHLPVVLVATKVDLKRQRKISETTASDLANEYNCSQFDVSAANDDNVCESFHATFKQIEVRHFLRSHNNTGHEGTNILTAWGRSERESHIMYSTL